MADMRFDGKVAIITGAGRGLGREHALMLAARGCSLVINDVGTSSDRTWNTVDTGYRTAQGAVASDKVADECVAAIRAAGGRAVANYDSVENGEAIVKTAIEAFGRVDIVVNNAGIVTPEVWSELTLESWQRTLSVNTTGVFKLMKAVWPVFVEQGYGRCICVASPAIFGAGVAAYSASKIACIGLCNSLQFEAKKLKLDIKCNTVIPLANTRMTQDLDDSFNERRASQGKKSAPMPPQQLLDLMSPDKVSAMVAYLSHEGCTLEATIHEAGAGHFAQLHWARSAPLFATEAEGVKVPTPEMIRDGQQTLNDFVGGDMPKNGDGRMGAPTSLERVMGHLQDHRSRM